MDGALATSTTPAGTKTFTSDLTDELISVTLEDDSVLGYTHDAVCNRTSRTVDGVTDVSWAWDEMSGLPVRVGEYAAAGALSTVWLPDPTSSTDSPLADSPVGFAGQYLDDATGLYDMRARDYDPSSGRFNATDPVAVPTGMPFVAGHSYAFNNPIMYSDPSGLFVGCSGLESFVWGLIGKSCGSNNGANNAGNFTGGFGEEHKTLATDTVAGVAQLATPVGQGQAAAGYAGAVQNDGWVKGSLNASGATDLANDAYMTPVYLYQGNYRAAGASAADPTWTAIMTYESALLGAMGPAMGALGPMAASSRCVTVVGVRTARFVTTSAGVHDRPRSGESDVESSAARTSRARC